MRIPTKKYLRKKANKLCLIGQIVIELNSGILTEPLNLRDEIEYIYNIHFIYILYIVDAKNFIAEI